MKKVFYNSMDCDFWQNHCGQEKQTSIQNTCLFQREDNSTSPMMEMWSACHHKTASLPEVWYHVEDSVLISAVGILGTQWVAVATTALVNGSRYC